MDKHREVHARKRKKSKTAEKKTPKYRRCTSEIKKEIFADLDSGVSVSKLPFEI